MHLLWPLESWNRTQIKASQIKNTVLHTCFGYCLTRYCHITENAFCIIATIFRVFCSKINLYLDKATKVVVAAVVLHNMQGNTLGRQGNIYTPPGFADEIDEVNVVEGSWKREISASVFQPPQHFGNNSNWTAESTREYFVDYFCGPVAVPWQWKRLI